MPEADHTIEAFICITSDYLTPEEITQILEIQPTKAAQKGQPVSWASKIPAGRPVPQTKENTWQYYSSVPPANADMDKVIYPLAKILETNMQRFRQLEQCSIGITCVVWQHHRDARPYIGLQEEVVRILADVGGYFDVDLY